MVSEKNGKKKNLSVHFWELSNELLCRIWSVHRYCINSVCVLGQDFFESSLWEDEIFMEALHTNKQTKNNNNNGFMFFLNEFIDERMTNLAIKVIFRRCPWCNGYRRRNWTQRYEFKSWTECIPLNTLGKGMDPIILPSAMGK